MIAVSNQFKLLTCATIAVTIYSGDVRAQVAKPTEIQITAYRTTIFADCKDEAVIVAKLIDSEGKDISGIAKDITYKISCDASILSINGINAESMRTDSTWEANLNGAAHIILTSTAKEKCLGEKRFSAVKILLKQLNNMRCSS